MELKRLKHLVALADTRNFGRAATRCHLSQPAFSRSVQAAEEELGMQLFERNAPEITCTAAGAFVVERARKVLYANRCLERDVSLYRGRQMGELALGVGPYPAATLLPALLMELRTRFPGVNSRVEVNNAKYLAEHLRAEELDFFVADIRNVPSSADLAATRIGRLSAGFFVRPGHPLSRRRSIKAAALLPFGVASVRIPDGLRVFLGGVMGLDQGERLPLAVECDDLSLLRTVAMTTDTVLACPDAAARQDVENATLMRLNVSDLPPLANEMCVFSLKGRSHSHMAQFALEFLSELATRQATAC